MKLSVNDFINNTETNDFKVYSVDLNIAKTEFNISFEGVYYFKENTQKPIVMENGGEISISSFESFEARYFMTKEKLLYTLDYKNIEMIGEVNEKSYEDEVFRLAGFGKNSGYWIEYLIKKGIVVIYLKD
jgi:hypothetical protein